jgi:hypothetical protein
VKDVVERPLDRDVVRDVVLDEDEVAPGQVLDVGDVARDQAVHPDHGNPPLEQVLAQVRADEARGTGHQRSRQSGSLRGAGQ